MVRCEDWFDFLQYDMSKIEIYTDHCLKIENNNKIKILIFTESPRLLRQRYELLQCSNIDLILTYDKDILNNFSNSKCVIFGTSWIKESEYNLENLKKNKHLKENKISFLVGNKQFLTGHHIRQWLARELNKQQTNNQLNYYDLYLSKDHLLEHKQLNYVYVIGESKMPLFYKYKYHLCIENCKEDNYFTEKIVDCFLTKTIPIYWGCPNIGDFFNLKGIIVLNKNTINDLVQQIMSINLDLYDKISDVIEENYIKALSYLNYHKRLENEIINYLGATNNLKKSFNSITNNKMVLYMNLMGGFGNVMFQFMYAYATARKYGMTTNNIKLICPHNARTYPSEYEFLKSFPVYKTIDQCDSSKRIFRIDEQEFIYHQQNIEQINKNIYDLHVVGYFQSYKYSQAYFSEIKNIVFTNLSDKINKIKEIHNKLSDKTNICVHFRLTDYIDFADVHYVVRDDSWYEKSIKILKDKLGLNNIRLILFSDNNDYLKKIKLREQYDNVIAADYGFDTEETFLLMSYCQHFVIPNSTYSLLAYYFRQDENASVVIPDKWFGHKGPVHKLEDIIEITENVIINPV